MQIDAEEDENIFYKPPVEPAARASTESAPESQAPTIVATAEEDDD
jgi:sorting nexin-1/2